jgi:pyruvate/2-oxoglutarate/acetoin dehydrogenase E1 component
MSEWANLSIFSEIKMTYFDELIRSMDWLASDPRTLFLGQSVKWDGHSLFKSLKNVPDHKRLEMPVAEDFQMGFSLGLALQGVIPVSIYPRWDFLLLAANQLVNHLDKIPQVSRGGFEPRVIIRVSVGSTQPLNPGPQHCQDHTKAFSKMLQTVEVIDLQAASDIFPAYYRAMTRADGYSTLLVEHADLYNGK